MQQVGFHSTLQRSPVHKHSDPCKWESVRQGKFAHLAAEDLSNISLYKGAPNLHTDCSAFSQATNDTASELNAQPSRAPTSFNVAFMVGQGVLNEQRVIQTPCAHLEEASQGLRGICKCPRMYG